MIQYNPIKINPSRPMSVDVANSLATTLREGNALARESKNQLNAVTMALPTAPTEEQYKRDKLAKLNQDIEDASMFGNMFWAQDEISAAADEITKDPVINDSIKSYQNYTTWKQSIQDRTDISQLTKNRVIATNPYISTADRTNPDTNQITPWEFNGVPPVKDISINELFDAALQRINPEYIYSEDFVFYDDKGNAHNEYIPGITVLMTNKQTRESINLTREKIEEAVKAAISADQQYRDAINQERLNIEWAKNQEDYDGQFNRFLNENGDVVNYDEYITRLVRPLANSSSYQKTKNIDEWSPTTININSGNDKGNGDDMNGLHPNYQGIGISFEGYKTTYTNTLTTEIVATRGSVNDEVSNKLSELGVDMNNINVDINNPNAIIDYINNNEHLSNETKQTAIDYVNIKSNYYQAQNNTYNQMLEDANPEGRVTKVFMDNILNNKKINFNDSIFKDIDKEMINKYGAIYANAISGFYTNYERPGQIVSPNSCSKSGVYFKSNKELNKFISLFGDRNYMKDQGYQIIEQDGYKIVYITNKDTNLVYQFANKIDEYINTYDDNIYRYFETDSSLLPDSKLHPNANKKKEVKQHYGNNRHSDAYGDINMRSILRNFNKIKEGCDKEFGNQEILVPTINSATPDVIIDEVWGDVRIGAAKYTDLKGKMETIGNTLKDGLRSGRPLEMNRVQIGDDETGEYRNVKRKELDEIQALIRNPKSDIIIRYTTSINGIVPYCSVISEDGSKQYNFTYDGFINDPLVEDLNKDIQYANTVNKYAYLGYDIQIGVNNDEQAISLKAENNGDDTFSFYLIDNNGEKIDGIKLDSYDAATLKRTYDALAPYIDKQFSKEGLTKSDKQEIENNINIFNYTLINNYAQNVDGLDPRTIDQLNTYIQEKNWNEDNWLSINGVSPVQMLLGAIGLTYSE